MASEPQPSSTPDSVLTCPQWVRFWDQETGVPYFYNVITHERACFDPDAEGELRCASSHADRSATTGSATDAPSCDGVEHRAKSKRRRLPAQPPDAKALFPGQSASGLSSAGQAGGSLTGQEASAVPINGAWWLRPARVQKAKEKNGTAYIEGQEEYNIWSGKFTCDRFEARERERASTKCDPTFDAGWTRVDLPGAEKSYFCFYFAKGCCNLGHQCTYYHRVPTSSDEELCDVAHDVFGRERFSDHREDMGGVGSFNCESKTLFVGDIRFDRTRADAVHQVESQLVESFSVWGTVENVRVIASKGIGFVRYTHRFAAEFAKVAMADQRMGSSERIHTRWASDDPNPRRKKELKIEHEQQVDAAVLKQSQNWSEIELAALHLTHQPSSLPGSIAPYPDTSRQYPAPRPAKPMPMPVTVMTWQEQESVYKKEEVAANIGRMNEVLSKIDAIQCSVVLGGS